MIEDKQMKEILDILSESNISIDAFTNAIGKLIIRYLSFKGLVQPKKNIFEILFDLNYKDLWMFDYRL